jgi:hypothetical protein
MARIRRRGLARERRMSLNMQVMKGGAILMVLAVLAAPGWAEEERKPEPRHVLYPFEVTLGGQKAVMKEGNTLFAVVEKPVRPDALLVLEEPSPMLIINVFPCQEDGTVLESQTAAILFVKEAKEVKLDATMDKKRLVPGTYLMNVVAHSKTSRVVFTVGEPGKVKMPDLSKIFKFLSKK